MFSSLFNPALNELKPLCQHWCHMRTFLLRHFRSLECPTDHFMEIPGIWHTIFFVMTRFGVQTLRVTTFRSNVSTFTFQVMYAYKTLHSSLAGTDWQSGIPGTIPNGRSISGRIGRWSNFLLLLFILYDTLPYRPVAGRSAAAERSCVSVCVCVCFRLGQTNTSNLKGGYERPLPTWTDPRIS